MQDKTLPLSPHLTEAEKLEICSLVLAGLPLPSRYKERLIFSMPRQEEASAHPFEADFSVCEYFPCGRELAQDSAMKPACPPEGWANLLAHGDNRDVLRAIVAGSLSETVSGAGGIKLIYADPPFAVGSDFMIELAPGFGAGTENGQAVTGRAGKNHARRKSPGNSAGQRLSTLAFSDSWGPGPDSFEAMLYARIKLMHAALAEDGSMYLHCDRRAAPLARLFMDYIFGPERMLGEIIWHYTGGGRAKRYFSRKHDVILHYAKSGRWTFNLDAVRVPYKKNSGYARSGITSAAGKHYAPHPQGTPVDDVWSIPIVNPMGHERLGYPTQKPEALLERIIEASSNPGDLVADFFCGSGTTLAVAERLGRKWLGVDKGAFSIHETRKRLLLVQSIHEQPAMQPETGSAGFCRCGTPFAVLESRKQGPFPSGKEGNAIGEDIQSDREIVLDRTKLRLPGAVIRAELVRTAGGFRVELKDYSLTSDKDTPELHQLARAWPDWIDYWSVDSNYLPGSFRSCWQSFRTRQDRALAIQSPVFSLPGQSCRAYGSFPRAAVLVVDIFSQSHMLELDTRPLSSSSSHADGDPA